MDRDQFCNEILKIDDRIRFVGIYDEGEFYFKMREGLTSYHTPEQTENSLVEAEYRWASRKKDAPNFGKPIFAMAKYEKIYRITIPIGTAGLIIVTTELNVNMEEIVEKIIDKREKLTINNYSKINI
ncbi:MAG: conserved hypothetical protein [Marine Group I thaumarchaeote]|nr:MAG: conserved hypothetical protein [Marine Group I thaumarchaeote]